MLIFGFALLGGASVRVRTYFCTLDLADLSRRVLFILEIIQILWLTSREMIVITHSQQRRMSFPSSDVRLLKSRGRAARQYILSHVACKLMIQLPYPFAGYGLAWVAVFVYELLIFVLTIFRTCKTRGFRQLFSSNRNIIDIIFQDGIFFVTPVI
jgi:hypothetical protein